MTAILFSRAGTIFDQHPKDIDADILDELIAREEENLKCMHTELIGSITLCRLQLKLISALKNLLTMIGKPCSIQELMHQISKIMSLYHDIDGELSKAQRHKEGVNLEILAQELRLQEMIRLMSLAYYDSLNAAWSRASSYFKEWMEKKEAQDSALRRESLEAAQKMAQLSRTHMNKLRAAQDLLKSSTLNNIFQKLSAKYINKPKPHTKPKPKPGFGY